MDAEEFNVAIINRLRIVDTLRDPVGEKAAREFAEALQDEMAPLMTQQEIQLMISGLVDQIEARMWRVTATGVVILSAIAGITTTLILALN